MKHIYKIFVAMMLTMALTAGAAIPTLTGRAHVMRKSEKNMKGLSLTSNISDGKSRVNSIAENRNNPKEAMAKQREMRRELRTKRSLLYKQPNEMHRATGQTYTVTCSFPGEDMPDFSIYNEGMYEEADFETWLEMEEAGLPTDTYKFQIPAGTYDICAQFYSYKEGLEGFAYVVRENVVVNGDVTVNFSRDDATEKVTILPYMRNGKQALFPIVKFLEEEPWEEIDDSNVTADYFYADYLMYREGCEAMAMGYINANITFEGEETGVTVITNKLSDKYHLVANCFVMDLEGEMDLTLTDVKGMYTRSEPTYNTGYVRYDVPEFAQTPVASEFGVEKFHMAVQGVYWWNDVQMGGGGLYTADLKPAVYLAQQPSTVADFKHVAKVINVQAEKTYTFEEEEDGEIFTWTETARAEVCALPALRVVDDWEYINQNHSDCGNYSYQVPVEGPVVEYPGLEPYCYMASSLKEPIGNYSPICVIMTQVGNDDGISWISAENQAYIGRYGEVRNADFWMTDTKITDAKGETLFDSADGGYLGDWTWEYFNTPHDPTALKYDFMDNNVLVDGTLKGFNHTVIEIDEAREDKCSPTPQMLIFKNSSGQITDRFKKGADGVIEFSAGDFNWFDNDDDWGFTVEEADITVEYAPYGEDAWQTLSVTEVPENFYMPGFGFFYRGSLESVTVPSANGWYDLRMTLTDKAGNKTVEHISPAFMISENSGLRSVTTDGVKVWMEGGIIRTNVEVASIELFSIDGRKLGATCGNSLAASRITGVAIVRVTTTDGRVITNKLLAR